MFGEWSNRITHGESRVFSPHGRRGGPVCLVHWVDIITPVLAQPVHWENTLSTNGSHIHRVVMFTVRVEGMCHT